jgi:transketolase
LTNLTVLIDHNELQGFGTTTSVASMAPLWDRLRGFDAEVVVVNGHDSDAIRTALDMPSDRLKIVVLKTVKGHGVSFMEHRMEWHYLPLSAEQYAAAIAQIDAA